MSLVCFDTQIVIWAVKGEATSGQEEMILKAKYLLQKCKEDKQRILIPSIVLAELLSGLDPDRHDKFVQVMQKRFIIPSFDTQAAAQYAKIWRDKKQIRQEINDSHMATREEMKADCMIEATAIAYKASCIYTHDVYLKKFAKGYIDTRDLPEVPPTITQSTFME